MPIDTLFAVRQSINIIIKNKNVYLQKKQAMLVTVLKSKIHRVIVTESNIDYIGSITIDEALMEASGIIENEKVDIYNITNGERLSTYAIKGERGSGVIGLNGAAALKVPVGSLIIIAAYGMMEQEEALQWRPTVIFPENNHLR